jgi:hypothetical protein
MLDRALAVIPLPQSDPVGALTDVGCDRSSQLATDLTATRESHPVASLAGLAIVQQCFRGGAL